MSTHIGSYPHVDERETRLVSRKGNVYRNFQSLCAAIQIDLDCRAVLDGEIVCLDAEGRPQFYHLMRKRAEPVYYVFDVLWLDGRDVRHFHRNMVLLKAVR
jgi:bifunctional non-homologous end joining protein LigD